ncbi:ankyrin repeat protein, putative [Trichomonas vaginalis G3]|uniref:Ankyrin repeat protein, putative n=1 Tax=Trichomonas vaginalis (strain ATCC PRA-98 / G3) TaxID=412133 RepID=A2DUD8_TRIV3|nr:spectrin binding [Trichomonas vaginalis G3]EAY15976.1 ankyrin repeat protein, putative [Trichomonas vaginalis G3]KAI5523611.1 spectrin binding [Trichomonas vaginalis G3]|eukprot:XP_001328199.1 ankyrin repeat protein [Trichomonas vaginalis G3]
MYDQIDKFKEYIIENQINDIRIDTPHFIGLSPIEACAYYGSVNIFNFLISNFDKKISDKCTRLSFIGGNIDIINECLKFYTNYSIFLGDIISSHNDEFLDFIFQRDLFDPNYIGYNDIIQSQNLKAVFYIFEKDKNFLIPWCAAFPQTIDILQSRNLDLSITTSNGFSLLHFAAYHNNADLCKYIISSIKEYQNINNITDNNHLTPLHHAAKNNCREAAGVLILNGANINEGDKYRATPLHHAVEKNNIEIIEFLISNGANINAKDRYEKTALCYAIEHNRMKIIKFLLSNGANFNEKDQIGLVALHYAAIRNCRDIAELLISLGADINSKDQYGKLPLHYTARNKNLDAFELLFSYGIDLNAKDYDGKTILHYAAINNNVKLTEFLISHGADLNIKDSFKQTAYDYALMSQSTAVSSLRKLYYKEPSQEKCSSLCYIM